MGPGALTRHPNKNAQPVSLELPSRSCVCHVLDDTDDTLLPYALASENRKVPKPPESKQNAM